MRFLLLVLLISFPLLSSTLILENNSSSEDFEIEYFEDKKNNLNLEEIRKEKKFIKINNHISLAKKEGTIWYRFFIKNNTKEVQKRVFFVTEPYLWDIELFVLKNNNIIHRIHTGSGVLDEKAKVAKIHPQIELEIKPAEIQEIYIRVYTQYHHTFALKLYKQKDLVEYKVLKSALLSLYFGAVLSLLLYNFFIYFSIRDINYIYYIGFVFFYALSQLDLYALFPLNNFSSVDFSYKFSTSHIFWFAFHTLFSVKLLNIKEYYPKLDKLIVYCAYFLFILGFWGLYDLVYPIHIMSILMVLLPFFILMIAIQLHFKKNKIAIFYIIAQFLFISSSMIFGLLYAGVLEYNNFTRYVNLVGSFSDIILFSLALAYKTRLIIKENQEQKELVDEYSKLSFLGQTIINIYHQWKSPVNNIYNSINHIETAKEFQDKNLNKIVDENLDEIKHNTLYLRETASSYLNYYKGIDKPKSKFNLRDEITLILKLHKQELDKLKIQIVLSCDDELNIFLQKNILTNIVIILIENSINVFKQREIKNPELKILINKREDKIDMIFCDNAGGIKTKNCDDIFKKNHSISDSTGLGLFLIKDFLCPKINANIKVKNIKNGACFELSIAN